MPPERAARITREDVGDWNRRFGIELSDGARVEAVLYRGDTLCISTQVGCAVACPFCASGSAGLSRSLSLLELEAQVEVVESRGHEIKRVTLSGVGEPLHAFAGTSEFLVRAHARGLGVSVTTSGGPLRKLRELLRLPHNGVTISVHAGTELTRARLVPKGPSLDELFETLSEELPRLSGRRRKKLALAYLAIAGANDAPSEVDAFVARVRPLGLAVHLYALNPIEGARPGPRHQPFVPLERQRYEALYDYMVGAGLRVRMSSKARLEANGGCGTLVAHPRRRSDLFA